MSILATIENDQVKVQKPVIETHQVNQCHCGGAYNLYQSGNVKDYRCNLCGARREDARMKTRQYPPTQPPKHKESATAPADSSVGSQEPKDDTTKLASTPGVKTNPRKLKSGSTE